MRRRKWIFGLILGLVAVSLYLVYERASRADRPRWVKAEADIKTLVSAVSLYQQHTGALPAALTDLIAPVSNAANVVSGPFMAAIPAHPSGWTAYRYEPRPDGTFVITAAGDGRTVSINGPTQR